MILILISLITIKFGFHKEEKENVHKDEKLVEQKFEIEKKAATIDRFNMEYDEKTKKSILKFIIKNNSDDDLDLTKYILNFYDKDNKLIFTYSGSPLGKVDWNSSKETIIYLDSDYSNVQYIDIVKSK